MIAIDVLGTPAPKGSARAFFKSGMKRAVIVKDNDAKQRGWDLNVRTQALAAVGEVEGPVFVEVGLDVSIVFRIARPNGHWHAKGGLKPKAPLRPQTKPDIDKLARTTLDSLTGIVFDDDSRIVKLTLRKEYAIPGREGAYIEVQPA